jgi:DNA-binding NarL/FixJ family response regulator
MLQYCEDIQVVGEAASGEEAIAQAQFLSPDIILMNLKMPGMDGITATRRVKETAPGVNIVILTLYEGELVSQPIEAGASGYLLKNIERNDLIQAIHAVHRGNSWLDPSLTQHILTEFTELRREYQKSILSDRQRKILRLIAAGLSTKGISDQLFISVTTVRREIRNIFNKLGVDDRANAVSEAFKRRLI